jgi:ubiquinone/menaquinone biosynthesis C-methylase UbiE
MEPELQRRVQRYGWDRASLYYEGYWQQQLKPAQDLLVDWASPKSGDRVLDIACGTGLVSFRMRELVGKQGYVLGTDLSDKMIEQSSERARDRFETGIEFKQMDAEALQVPDESFDLVLCALGLMYFPEPIQALKEMYRSLRSGGRMVAAVWGRREQCGWSSIFQIVDQHVSSEVCPMFFQLGNPGMLEMSMARAGFEKIRIHSISSTLVYQSAEEACGAAFLGGPVALAYHKFQDPVKEEVQQAYLDSISRFKNGNGYVIPGEFVIGMGFKNQMG